MLVTLNGVYFKSLGSKINKTPFGIKVTLGSYVVKITILVVGGGGGVNNLTPRSCLRRAAIWFKIKLAPRKNQYGVRLFPFQQKRMKWESLGKLMEK